MESEERKVENDLIYRWEMNATKFRNAALVFGQLAKLLTMSVMEQKGFRMEICYDAEADVMEAKTFKWGRSKSPAEDGSNQESPGEGSQ